MVSEPSTAAFAAEVTHWSDIPGWFHWREGQQEAITTFPSGSTFVEVVCYLGLRRHRRVESQGDAGWLALRGRLRRTPLAGVVA